MPTPADCLDSSFTLKDEIRRKAICARTLRQRAAHVAVGVFLLLAVVLLCAGGVAVAQSNPTTVHLNEVESNGGTPDDWFELYNTGASAVDVSGWKMKDNDNTHPFFVFPAGSIVAPAGFLVFDTQTATTPNGFPFGLGSADSVRIYDSTENLLEIYSWTAHAATTYGRCPNGTGDFVTTVSSTKGTKNDCPVRINEVESNGGTPDDWFELYNAGTASFDVSGWKMKDNDDTHPFFVFPAGSTIAAGAYLVFNTQTTSTPNGFPFGLGSADSVRVFDPSEVLYDSFSWTAHAATTYGRCPNGTGAFTTTAASTKGTANSCGGGAPASPVKINELESSGGVPVDWIELYNPSASSANIGSFVLKDNDDSHSFTIPAGTVLAAGAYQAFDVDVAGGFGLGDVDSARLFDNLGTLLDTYSWTSHAPTTYGRCPDGTGDFAITVAPTKGAANACRVYQTWPGGTAVQTVDGSSVFGGNLSGLDYEGTSPPVMWAIRNGPSTLYRLVFNGTIWTPDPADGWGAGKTIVYPNGMGGPDSEGVTYAGAGSSEGIFVSTERDNNNNGVSRIAILRFDPAQAGTTLTATNDWNLTSDLPASGPNLGAEAITWIPDSFLTASNFFDETKGHIYVPEEYPNHGTGLFFVGLESNGGVYAYALDQTPGSGSFNKIATIASGFPGVMDLQFDPVLSDFWAICDDTCQGRSVVFRVDGTGRFVVAGAFERPAGMPNFNNEGFAITPASECVSGFRPVYWSDDSEDAGHSIRSGTLSCSPIITNFTDAIAPKAFPTGSPSPNGAGWNTGDVNVAWNWADNPGGSGIDNANCTTNSLSSGEGTLLLNANCKDLAGNTGSGSYTVKVDKTDPTVTGSATKADATPYTFGAWSNKTVTVDYTCSDAVSGIASCSGDAVFGLDGEWSTSGSATDNAGRTGTTGPLSVRIDATPPQASPTALPSPNGAGWNSSDVAIAWNWSDNAGGSGIDNANCTTSTLSSGEGTLVLNATCTDLAGNTGNASYTVEVDKTKPTITATATKADATPYTFGAWTNQAVTVHFTCADSGSLIAACSPDAVISAEGDSFASGSATDNAGNTNGVGSLLVRIDRGVPRVTITSPERHSYLNTARLRIQWYASDAASGIGSLSATLDGDPVTEGQLVDLFLRSLGPHAVVVNVTDGAGNTASDRESFLVIATVSSIDASIDRLLTMGAITSKRAANSLEEKLGDNPHQLRAFLNELDAQRGKKINQQAYDLLRAAALYVIAHPTHGFEGKHDDRDDHDSRDGDKDRDDSEHHDSKPGWGGSDHDDPKHGDSPSTHDSSWDEMYSKR